MQLRSYRREGRRRSFDRLRLQPGRTFDELERGGGADPGRRGDHRRADQQGLALIEAVKKAAKAVKKLLAR